MSKILAYIDYVAMAREIVNLRDNVKKLNIDEININIKQIIKILDEGIDKDVRKYITNVE